MLRLPILVMLLLAPLACATAGAGAAGATRSGTLTFARADSLDLPAHDLVAVRAAPGGGIIVLDGGPEGCGPITPWGTYVVDGSLVRVSLTGIDRVMVCRDAVTGPRRRYAARLGGLAAGTYDVVFSFASEGAAWSPLRRTLIVP